MPRDRLCDELNMSSAHYLHRHDGHHSTDHAAQVQLLTGGPPVHSLDVGHDATKRGLHALRDGECLNKTCEGMHKARLREEKAVG